MTADYFIYRCDACGAMQAATPDGAALLLDCCEDHATVEVLPVVEFTGGSWTGWKDLRELAGETRAPA